MSSYKTCTACSKDFAKSKCANCYKVNYCSKECQKEHYKIHKKECYPVKVDWCNELGRYLVATRDIKKWEIILKENPISFGPTVEVDFEGVCLGCLAYLTAPFHKCSTCGWPVCDEICEKKISHAEFECQVFAEQASLQFDKDPLSDKSAWQPYYGYIHLMRCLLLKEKDPVKWSQIMNLMSNVQIKSDKDEETSPNLDLLKGACNEFLWDKCKLTQFSDQNEIDHVRGVLATNVFSGEDYFVLKPRTSSYLYYIPSMMAHNCVPNTYRIINDKSSFELRASVQIKAGSPVTTFYTNSFLPTVERQYHLKLNYKFTCKCTRCLDPTELGSFFSGIKCNKMNDKTDSNCPGYLLPTNPLEEDPIWQCTGTGTGDSCKRVVDAIRIQEFNSKFEIELNNVKKENTWRNYKILDGIYKSYGEKVHINHAWLINLEFDIAQIIHNLISSNIIPFSVLQRSRVIDRLLDICYRQLDLLDILRPGFNCYRGKVLHILQNALMIQLLESKPTNIQDKRDKLKKIQQYREEAVKILSVEPSDYLPIIVATLKDESVLLACKLQLGLGF